MPSDQNGLFDIPITPEAQAPAPVSLPITEVQVQAIRDAFAVAGIEGMDERKSIIESCTIRPVANIRELLAKDVRPVLRRIEQRKNYTGAATGSAWDNREEDTWIDRL